MPTLPSGMKLSIFNGHIMEPDINWFKAPEGHFWYWTPAEENLPPFSPDDVVETMPATALVPETIEDMANYIQVVIGAENDEMYWRGEMINEFPKYSCLNKEDLAFWQNWLESAAVEDYLKLTIQKCQIQSDANKQARGFAVIQSSEGQDEGKFIGEKTIVGPGEESRWHKLRREKT